MGSIPPELSLDVRQPIYIPKTISFFLSELTTIGDFSERMLRLDDYVKRLEDEMRKIDAFKRELPLSLLLLNDAIVTLKDESMQCKAKNVEPILEEFIPLKKDCIEDEKIDDKKERRESRDNKMNWMSSVQLWNADGYKNNDSSNSNRKQDSAAQFIKGAEKKSCLATDDPLRAFMPFKGLSDFPAKATRREDKRKFPVAGLSLVMPGTNNNSSEEVVCSSGLNSKTGGSRAVSSSTPRGPLNLGPQPQNARKQRRCWSPELHRRFVVALQQLGGSHVATPKQIRELMQVDGLTNDEVKSHLQKYRLHTRRSPAATAATPPNQSAVILGDLWMPQEEYSESSKHNSTSQSGSPQGPLQLAATGGSNSMEEEQEEDDDDDDDDDYGD